MPYLGFDEPLGRLNLGFTESPSVFGAHVRPYSQVGRLLQGLKAIEQKRVHFKDFLFSAHSANIACRRRTTTHTGYASSVPFAQKSTQLSDSGLENRDHLLWVLENKSLREQTKRPLYWSFDDCREDAMRNAQHHLVSSLDVYQTLQPPPRTDLQRVGYTQETDSPCGRGDGSSSSSLQLCADAHLMKALHLIAVYLDKRWME